MTWNDSILSHCVLPVTEPFFSPVSTRLCSEEMAWMLHLSPLNTQANDIVCTTQSLKYDVYSLSVWLEISFLVALELDLSCSNICWNIISYMTGTGLRLTITSIFKLCTLCVVMSSITITTQWNNGITEIIDNDYSWASRIVYKSSIFLQCLHIIPTIFLIWWSSVSFPSLYSIVRTWHWLTLRVSCFGILNISMIRAWSDLSIDLRSLTLLTFD